MAQGTIDSRPADEAARVSGFRRYGIVGAALFALIAVILVGGYFLGNHLRPPVGMEPVGLSTTSASSVASVPSTPAASVTSDAATASSGSPQASSAAAVEVQKAYLQYWAVYSEAMYTLDASHLADVASGERLQQATDEVQKVKAQGKAAKIDVQHNIGIFDVTDSSASVHDEYINNSYSIDPSTKKAVGAPGQSQHITDTYLLQRVTGVWKVVSGVRESGS